MAKHNCGRMGKEMQVEGSNKSMCCLGLGLVSKCGDQDCRLCIRLGWVRDNSQLDGGKGI